MGDSNTSLSNHHLCDYVENHYHWPNSYNLKQKRKEVTFLLFFIMAHKKIILLPCFQPQTGLIWRRSLLHYAEYKHGSFFRGAKTQEIKLNIYLPLDAARTKV